MDFEFESSLSIDNYLRENDKINDKIKVSSVQLDQYFERRDGNVLINKSTRDLWKLNQTDSGDLVVERLFDFKGDQ